MGHPFSLLANPNANLYLLFFFKSFQYRTGTYSLLLVST